MTGRPLGPDERALWARVAAGVRPLRRSRSAALTEASALPPLGSGVVENHAPAPRQARGERIGAATGGRIAAKPVAPPADTLDAAWDRRLRRGLAAPDRTLDLHGMTQAAAHAALEAALGDALAAGARLLLLVTGRPPRPGTDRPHARGAIRAAVPDWLAASRHADRIAAVRSAHPRHGGAGALYVVLRRSRARGG